MPRRAWAAAFLLVLAQAAIAEEAPDLIQLLTKVDEATKNVRTVCYNARFFGENLPTGEIPIVEGKVLARQAWRSALGYWLGKGEDWLRFEGAYRHVDGAPEIPFFVVTDGKTVTSVDHKREVVVRGSVRRARGLQWPGRRLLMNEFILPRPFNDEIVARKRAYEGAGRVGDVDCHVVYVVYQNGTESRWYFGKQDHLPRRVERIIKGRGINGAAVLECYDLEVNPDLTIEDFRIDIPEGYRTEPFKELLPEGAEAPVFELQTPDGRSVSLRSLRGRVVVIEFWATWARGCEIALSELEQLKRHFKDQPVEFLAINCWESDQANPDAFLERHQVNLCLLIDRGKRGNPVSEAYLIRGIPTTYVICPFGQVVYVEGGYQPGRQARLANAIEKALPRAEKPTEDR